MKVLIGRFQLPHLKHFELIDQADIVLIGSANVIDERNPFSATEREEMIRLVYPGKIIHHLNDIPEDDNLWKQQVEDIVYQYTTTPILLGNDKDASSFYLKLFDWPWVQSENFGKEPILNSTDLRALHDKEDWHALSSLTHPDVLNYLIKRKLNARV